MDEVLTLDDTTLAALTTLVNESFKTPVTVTRLGPMRVRIQFGNSTVAFALSDDENINRLANEIVSVLKKRL
jgi:hypothetical protein